MTKKSARHGVSLRRSFLAGAVAAGCVLATGLPAAHAAPVAHRAAAATTLSFWNGFSGPDGAAMKQIVNSFNASQKNYQINMTIIPQTNYGGALTTAIGAHKAPNILVVDDVLMATYASANILTPISQDATTVGLTSDKFFPSLWQGGNYNGTQYAVPMDALPLTFYWNKKVFRANGLNPNTPPTNEATFLADAQKMTHGGTYGFVVPPDWPEPFLFPTLLAQFGGQEMDVANKKLLWNSPAGLAALNLLHDWIYKYKISPEKTAVDYDISAISSGKAGMIVDGPWQYTALSKALGSDLGVAAVPQWGAKPGVFLGQHYFALYKSTGADPTMTKGALTFIKYFEDNSIQWAKAGDLPAYRPTLSSSAFTSLPYEVAIAKSLPYGYLNPKFPNYGAVSTALYPQIIKALLGQQAPKAALDYATTQGTKAIQQASNNS